MKFGKDIKGVIFDIDGVLLDSLAGWKSLGARYILSKGAEPEEHLEDILFSMSLEQGADYLREHYMPAMTREEILEGLRNALRDFYYYEVQAKPGTKEMMEGLKNAGVKMTVATSSIRGHVETALSRCGLLPYVDAVFTCSEAGVSKHTPDIFDIAASSMGTERKMTCVFEDSLYALRTAAGAGYRTVGVFDANGEPDQEGLKAAADIYVKDFGELRIL